MPHRITAIDDPRVAPFRNLRERTLRGESLFITEGLLVTRRLLASPYAAQSLLVSEAYVERLAPPAGAAGAAPEVYVADAALLRQIVGFAFHRGVLGLGRRADLYSLEDLSAPARAGGPLCLVICPAVNQSENLGLIFRSAAALGVDGVLLGPRTADPFSRRCLRVSMGGVLQVPLVRSGDLAGDVDRLRQETGLQAVAAVLDEYATDLAAFRWPARSALVVGNEFDGLDEHHLALCDHRVTIPMRRGVDSLNVAVAAGIFLYEMTAAQNATRSADTKTGCGPVGFPGAPRP